MILDHWKTIVANLATEIKNPVSAIVNKSTKYTKYSRVSETLLYGLEQVKVQVDICGKGISLENALSLVTIDLASRHWGVDL